MKDALNSQEKTRPETLSKEELVKYFELHQKSLKLIQAENKKLKTRIGEYEKKLGYHMQDRLNLEDQLISLKRELFGPSSEKQKREGKKKKKAKVPESKIQKPSDRHPDLIIMKENYSLENTPHCKTCGETMKTLSHSNDTEYVTVIRESFHIIKQHREKYCCAKCQSEIVTTPAPKKKIIEGGHYSSDFAVNVAVDKYAHHIPINRQMKKMKIQGLRVEHNTLIEQTHHLSKLMTPVYDGIRENIQNERVLGADETPWKMLEGDDKSNWYIWGYFGKTNAYYEEHATRSQAAANNVLKDCHAEYLMVDGYTGYHQPSLNAGIKIAHCWSHARRKFFDIHDRYPECKEILDNISELYRIEKETSPDQRLEARKEKSKDVVDRIKQWIYAQKLLPKSGFGRAVEYTKKHWQGLTRFLDDPDIPLDNNHSERGLRGLVLGRKNFYGNHSRKGARTSAILYSIIETCKLNNIDPFEYLSTTADAMLNNRSWELPSDYQA